MSNLVPQGVSPSQVIALFEQVVADRLVSKFIQTSALTVMIYDNVITLPEEVSVMWGSRWSRGKILFLLTRWPVVIESLLYFIYSMDYHLPVWFCDMETNLISWSVLIFLIPLQIVIVLRTIALWNEKRFVFYFLTFSAVATDITLAGLLANVSKNELHFAPDPELQAVFGCYADVTAFDPKTSTGGWSATMIFDFSIFSLTLVRSLRTAKNERTPLLKTLIMDGIVYYCVMLAVSIIALTFSVALSERRELLFAMVPPIFKACYCILGSRISIRLRESMSKAVIGKPRYGSQSVELSTLCISSGVDANAIARSDATFEPENSIGRDV